MSGPRGEVKVAFCGVSPDLVCARWAFHWEFSAPIRYDHKIILTKRYVLGRKLLCFWVIGGHCLIRQALAA